MDPKIYDMVELLDNMSSFNNLYCYLNNTVPISCIKFDDRHLFSYMYAFIDQSDMGLINPHLKKHNIKIKIRSRSKDIWNPEYSIFICKVPKKHESKFLEIIREINETMIASHDVGYIHACMLMTGNCK